MDDKYGRLFTEEDVVLFVQEQVGSLIEISAQEIKDDLSDFHGRFPADEPLFLLRGQDRFARGTVRKYRDLCTSTTSDDHLDGIDRALRRFEDFAGNSSRIKFPD